MPDPLILVDPVQQTSFTARAISNPTDPMPPGLVDGEFGHLRAILLTTVQVLRGITSPDGLKLGQVVGLDQLTPAALAELTAAVEGAVAADTTAAQTAATNAATSAGTATTKAGEATTAAGAAVAARDTILDAQTGTLAQIAAAQAAVTAAKTAVDATAVQVAADKGDAEGAVAELEGLTRLAGAWAEHMPSTIPPDVLAAMGITGDHWSARWWANQAAVIVASIQDLAEDAIAAVNLFNKLYLGPHAANPGTDNSGGALQAGALYWNTADLELRVWSGTIWAPATGAGAGAVTAATNVGGGVSSFKELVTGVLSFRTVTASGGLGVNQTADEIQLTINTVAWNKLTGTPTTIAGYGIADAYTKAEINSELDAIDAILGAKADKSYVDAQNSAQDTAIAAKAAKTYVDTQDAGLQTQIDQRVVRTSATGSARLPAGTTAQRDGAPSAGSIRLNSETGQFEGWTGAAWATLGADLSPYMPKTGGVFTGDIYIENGYAELRLKDMGADAGVKQFSLISTLGVLHVSRLDDAGAWLSSPILIDHATKKVSFEVRPAFAGNEPWDSGNFDPATKAPVANPAFTGTATVGGSTVITTANFTSNFGVRRVAYGNSVLTSPGFYSGGSPSGASGTFLSAVCINSDFTHWGYFYTLQWGWNGVWYTMAG